MSELTPSELFRLKFEELVRHPCGLALPKVPLSWLGIPWFCSFFGEGHLLWAQSDLDHDNAQLQEQIQSTQHPMLEDMPDRWEASDLDLPWTCPNRLPWNKSLRALAMDTLGLSEEQCLTMDSLVRAHGRPKHATFWLMLPWMESQAALTFQEALGPESYLHDLRFRSLKSGMDILYGTRYERSIRSHAQPILDERWQYRLRQKYRNIVWTMTIEKPVDRSFAELPGFFVQGKRGKMLWLLGDFHPQSGNRLLGNTQRMPAFANPWSHYPGTEHPMPSSRMSNGNQARGFSLQSAWRNYLIVMNSYALGILSNPLDGAPNTALWMNSLSLEKERSWGILGLQFAVPFSLNLPTSWNPFILATQIIKTEKALTPVTQFVNPLKTMGVNYKIQRKNYFFQSNFAIRPAMPNLPLNRIQKTRHSVFDNILAWDYSQLHTLVITPDPSWSMGMRWSKRPQGTEASSIFSRTLPTECELQSLELNAVWSPLPYWSLSLRSHWVEEGPDQSIGGHFIAWNRGLDGRILKGPLKDSRYTMIYKEAERGRQGDYLFQYLRMPWPLAQRKELAQGMSGYIQVAHGYSNPQQQTWAIAYNMLWKRVFRTQVDLKIGQTWAIAGPEGERVTVREDHSFGTGWWTGSSEQYRFTASLQGNTGGNGWRLWVRRIDDDENIRWESGFTYSQRWSEP